MYTYHSAQYTVNSLTQSETETCTQVSLLCTRFTVYLIPKGPAIKKKKKKFIFDNLSKFGHITGLLQNFPKNRAILVKLGKEKKIVKISFRLFYD